MVLTRCLGFAAYSILASKLIVSLLGWPEYALIMIPVLRVAGWMSVSTLVGGGQLSIWIDSQFLRCLTLMSTVALYATPYEEMVSRLSLFAGAVGQTLLPIF